MRLALLLLVTSVASDEILSARIASLAPIGDATTEIKSRLSSQPVDAVLFRTHFVDGMIMRKVRELVTDSRSHSSSQNPAAAEFEVTVLFDQDTVHDFGSRLSGHGFNHTKEGVRLMGLKLNHFTRYPSVKPLPIAKSHNQHLAYTSWWAENRDRRNWRFVSEWLRHKNRSISRFICRILPYLFFFQLRFGVLSMTWR
jgi:hypothetical protein